MQNYFSNNAAEPVGNYPHAKKVGNLLFISGIGPREPGKKEIPGLFLDENGAYKDHDIELQTKSVINNLKEILNAAGLDLTNLIDITVFLTNMEKDFSQFNKTYAQYFSKEGPTRTTVEVGSLPTPIAVEFKCIASFGE